MLSIQATLQRKPENLKPQKCVIQKVIQLETDEFAKFCEKPYKEYDFIKENTHITGTDEDGNRLCLLIMDKESGDGVIVDSEGYDYARYASFMPKAKGLAQSMDYEETRPEFTETASIKNYTMKTRLNMTMPEDIDARPVEITAAAVLTDDEYALFQIDNDLPEQYRERMNKYTKPVTAGTSIKSYEAMLVVSPNSADGIAVCGKNEVSYASYFPNAAAWLNGNIQNLANKIETFSNGITVESPFKIYLDDFGWSMETAITEDNGIGELLVKDLERRRAIESVKMNGDTLDIKLLEQDFTTAQTVEFNDVKNLNAALASQNSKSGDAAISLANLISDCRLEEVRLCHCDEDIELATVAELDADTLTEQGKADWADVLDAKVKRIYEGEYGIQLDLDGVSPERLTDFSMLLSGNCPVSEYDKWVSDASEQTMEEQM
jgi:hypothetical protein